MMVGYLAAARSSVSFGKGIGATSGPWRFLDGYGGPDCPVPYLAIFRSNVTRICSLPGMEENSVGRSFFGG